MGTKDIDTFVKAQRNTLIPNLVCGLALLLLCTFVALEYFGVEHEFQLTIITWAAILNAAAFGTYKWSFVPRQELVNIIERQINSDANAIEYISRLDA